MLQMLIEKKVYIFFGLESVVLGLNLNAILSTVVVNNRNCSR